MSTAIPQRSKIYRPTSWYILLIPWIFKCLGQGFLYTAILQKYRSSCKLAGIPDDKSNRQTPRLCTIGRLILHCLMTSSQLGHLVSCKPYLFPCLKITKSDIRLHTKWAVNMVIAEGHFLIFLGGLCGYVQIITAHFCEKLYKLRYIQCTYFNFEEE